MRLINIAGEVIADDGIDDGETIKTSSLGYNQQDRKRLSKDEQIKIIGFFRIAQELYDSDVDPDD